MTGAWAGRKVLPYGLAGALRDLDDALEAALIGGREGAPELFFGVGLAQEGDHVEAAGPAAEQVAARQAVIHLSAIGESDRAAELEAADLQGIVGLWRHGDTFRPGRLAFLANGRL